MAKLRNIYLWRTKIGLVINLILFSRGNNDYLNLKINNNLISRDTNLEKIL